MKHRLGEKLYRLAVELEETGEALLIEHLITEDEAEEIQESVRKIKKLALAVQEGGEKQ